MITFLWTLYRTIFSFFAYLYPPPITCYHLLLNDYCSLHPVCEHICVSPGVCISVCVSVNECFCVSECDSLFVFLCVCLNLCLYISVCMFLSVCLCLRVTVYVSAYVGDVYVSVPVFARVYVYVCLCVSVYICVCFSVSVFLRMYDVQVVVTCSWYIQKIVCHGSHNIGFKSRLLQPFYPLFSKISLTLHVWYRIP